MSSVPTQRHEGERPAGEQRSTTNRGPVADCDASPAASPQVNGRSASATLSVGPVHVPRAGTVWAVTSWRPRGAGRESITRLLRTWPAAERHRRSEEAKGRGPATIWRATLPSWTQVTR